MNKVSLKPYTYFDIFQFKNVLTEKEFRYLNYEIINPYSDLSNDSLTYLGTENFDNHCEKAWEIHDKILETLPPEEVKENDQGKYFDIRIFYWW